MLYGVQGGILANSRKFSTNIRGVTGAFSWVKKRVRCVTKDPREFQVFLVAFQEFPEAGLEALPGRFRRIRRVSCILRGSKGFP